MTSSQIALYLVIAAALCGAAATFYELIKFAPTN